MKEVTVAFNLLVIQFGHEIHMHARSHVRPLNGFLVLALTEVEVLPRREVRAHGRAYQENRLLLALHLSCLITLVFASKIPWHAVAGICDCQVESESWGEMSVPSALKLLGDSWRRIDFGHQVFACFSELATI